MSSGWQITIWRSECTRIFSSFSGYRMILCGTDISILCVFWINVTYIGNTRMHIYVNVNRLFMHIWIEVHSIRKVISGNLYNIIAPSYRRTWKKRVCFLRLGFMGLINELLSVSCRVVQPISICSTKRNRCYLWNYVWWKESMKNFLISIHNFLRTDNMETYIFLKLQRSSGHFSERSLATPSTNK